MHRCHAVHWMCARRLGVACAFTLPKAAHAWSPLWLAVRRVTAPASTVSSPAPAPSKKSPHRRPLRVGMKGFGNATPEVAEYCGRIFPEDPFIVSVRARSKQAGLPDIHVGPFDGRHLEVICRAIGAKKAVEIGTLAGLSGTFIARALPPDGVLHTFEYEPKHAIVAQETFELAGLASKVRVHVGAALDNLPDIEAEGPFDVVFIDADKPNYPNYVRWAARNLRIGGTVLVDNALAWNLVGLRDDDPALAEDPSRAKFRAAIMEANRIIADPDGPFRGTMIPTAEGLAMGVRIK